MSTSTDPATDAHQDCVEHLDVLVIGAGLSGVGAGYRLQTECPGKTYAILEGRSALGGTWDLFRYPGIRSDSDMYTLGYPFRPWTGERSIADGASIRQYIQDTAEAYGIDEQIRYEHKVIRASWSTATCTWTVDALVGPDAEPARFTCDFLYACSGYYRYDAGYRPEFPGESRFEGPILHPQQWPEDLDLTGKRVVVIGSGATAVTLVPSLTTGDRPAEHVTMLQRSPTWIASRPGVDALAGRLRRWLPGRLAAAVLKWRSVVMTTIFFQLCQRRPALARKVLQSGVAALLPADVAVDPHFTPAYDPWDQRLCLVPDGDLFAAMHDGRASVATDRIASFTEHGIALESGAELAADVIVSATGLTLIAVGGVELEVDGERIDPADTFTYKGHMLSGVPNFAICVGYTNASWTLRADLTSQAVCRLLNHLDARGYAKVVPTIDAASVESRPLLDLSSGYIARSAATMPKQGSRSPWNVRQNYVLDRLSTRFGAFGEALTFSRKPVPRPRTPVGATAGATGEDATADR